MLVLFAAGSWAAGAKKSEENVRTYTSCCDGSASAAVNAQLFANASDEGSLVQLFRRGAGGAPVASLPLSGFLGTKSRTEADLEGAAKLGDLVFWIGSHSRKSDGKQDPFRHVFFATQIEGEGLEARLRPFGRPFHGLVQALASEPKLASFEFGRAAGRPGEDPGGLNIEGLAAGPKESLWIGFRSPVPLGQALVVPLLNPRDVIQGEPAALGEAVRLDLQGLGIRDFARAGDRYLILAGPAEGGGRHRLFLWPGVGQSPVEVPRAFPRGLGAEGIVVDDSVKAHSAELLSDDGGERVGGVRCSNLSDVTRRAFRAVTVGF